MSYKQCCTLLIAYLSAAVAWAIASKKRLGGGDFWLLPAEFLWHVALFGLILAKMQHSEQPVATVVLQL